MNRIKNLLYPFIGVVFIIVVWIIIAQAVGVELVFPSPYSVIKSLIAILGNVEFYSSYGYTLLRCLIAFTLTSLIALLSSILATFFKPFEGAFYPLTVIMKAMPTISVILVCLIWFKSSISPVIVAFIVTFPLAYSNFTSSIKSVDEKILEMSKVYRVDRKKSVKEYILPTVINNSYDGIITLLSFTVKIVVSAEVLSETSISIGRLMQLSKLYLDTPSLIAYTLVTVLTCFLLEYSLKLIKGGINKR